MFSRAQVRLAVLVLAVGLVFLVIRAVGIGLTGHPAH